MAESIFKRAKAFIGLEEEGDGEKGYGEQLEMNTIFRGKREGKNEMAAFEVAVYEPKVYEDSLNISTKLRSGSPVIINLKHLDPSEGTRLIDFVCGTAYAIDGHMMKIGESIFLFTPSSISIHSAEERESLEDEVSFEKQKQGAFFSR